jgi:hypothetical protein
LQPVPLTVPAGNVFTRWGLAVSEKQIPQLVANIAKGQQEMELLESSCVRPRQARYQAALRPDMKYVKIIKDFPTELLLHLTNFASNCAKTVPNRFH